LLYLLLHLLLYLLLYLLRAEGSVLITPVF
jgi:hypothetical protein